ncbi:hypothetical protein LC605_22085 [Nostoc sp. CHAB 5836]|uniref:hypothetical protein n=1 Tax=Nostoc sp. CHAB 5836 TaxID=2780404 RepID=UPI001E2FC048|nr:hypothetical protein [Nostoc sp. CHAB 5836]MCC5617729.1 hypothetical protein [Nostoc sp. CHAB 5836]
MSTTGYAYALFNQSLEITERIGDVQTKAATLHELGYIYADKGEVDEAMSTTGYAYALNHQKPHS